MEKNFYQDNFEQLLKESADNFRMYPSKRVWHSIYNDLHPSRKWPSLAILLLLISSVVFVGLSNRSQADLNIQAKNTAIAGIAAKKETINTALKTAGKPASKETAGRTTPKKQGILHAFSSENKTIDTRLNPLNNVITDQNIESANIIAFHKNTVDDNGSTTGNTNDEKGNLATSVTKSSVTIDPKNALSSEDETLKAKLSPDDALASNKSAKDKAKKDLLKDNNKNSDKEWIEDYAFHNKPSGSKWKSRVTYELYTTPSVGYRTLKQNTSFKPFNSTSLVAANNNTNRDFEDALSQAAAINMELGGNVLYSLTKKLNLKIGVQLNYTNYNINAYELKHPTMTTLMLNDLNSGLPSLSPRSTTLANSEGVYSKKLNNNTYQISLPVGADIKLLGNETVKWFAGATIQPTYIVNSNAYFISSDLKNYVTDESLMRKWNLNAGIETFISYKTKSGIILNAGPQFRYQLLSTYSKQYTYDEKLYNLGVKIGVVTRF